MCYSGAKTSKYGTFARQQYSYMHMPFRQLAGFLTELHPDDRFIAYTMTEAAAPVHMYFDIDADLDKFPYLLGADAECIRVFMAALREFFQGQFQRALDTSGLLLLQATSSTKLSWHLHIRSEPFRDMTHHKLFVQQFREWLEQQQEEAEAEAEAAPEAELNVAAAHHALQLCSFTAAGAHSHEGRWQHIVDPQPYMKNQNLRAPYNRKPGKTALRVRKYEWDEHGQLRVLPELGDIQRLMSSSLLSPSAIEAENIDPEVLFNAHPSLAQPSTPGYVHLNVIPRRPSGRGRKRQGAPVNGDESLEAGVNSKTSAAARRKRQRFARCRMMAGRRHLRVLSNWKSKRL